MTPDQCFDEMAVVLGLPKDTGYTDILAGVKKHIDILREALDRLSKCDEKRQELKEENKKLKEEWVDPATYVLWEQAQVWVEELKKLKEENKKLKEECKDWKEYANEKIQDINLLAEENKKLKKYQTMIYCVWSDLYWADKSGCEVSFKDVANSCDYYDNEEFVKKEVVEDED